MLSCTCALPEARETSTAPPEASQDRRDKLQLVKDRKVQSVRSLLKQAFPGEFHCVFSDIRLLINDDFLMRQEAVRACSVHDKDSFTPVEVGQHGCQVLLTHHNDLGDHRFFDPHAKLAFKYDHLSKEASDFQPYPLEEVSDDRGDKANGEEAWRGAFQNALRGYVKSHYRNGTCTVFRKTLDGAAIFVACIECHQHRPSAFWNGIWRSEWIFPLTFPVTQVTGSISAQAHYFEDGNIHLTACKTIEEALQLSNRTDAARDFVQLVQDVDNRFQSALMEEYVAISERELKRIRRQLPITRSILDWNKMLASKILETDFMH